MGLALYNPLTDNWGEGVFMSGHPTPGVNESTGSSWDRVSANYLQNFGIPVLRGRAFTTADNETTAPVAIVNEAFVKRFFKSNENPLDQHFGLDMLRNAGTYRIVGVVRDAKFAGFNLSRPAQPMFYVPLAQSVEYPPDDVMKRVEVQSHFIGGIMLVTNGSPGALEPLLTKTLADLDPNRRSPLSAPCARWSIFHSIRNAPLPALRDFLELSRWCSRSSDFTACTAYTVAQRTNEIGIRMALGANRGRVAQLILQGAFLRVAIGLVIGLPLAIGAGRLIASELYGVASWDPIALIVAAGSLAIAAFFAAIIPAIRAASISPMTALRID